jgi:hypothetical protein
MLSLWSRSVATACGSRRRTCHRRFVKCADHQSHRGTAGSGNTNRSRIHALRSRRQVLFAERGSRLLLSRRTRVMYLPSTGNAWPEHQGKRSGWSPVNASAMPRSR